MNNSNRLAMFLLGATLALGFAWSASMLASSIGRMKHPESVRVKGTAERVVQSDRAAWSADCIVRSDSLAEGMAALEVAVAKTQAFLGENAVPAEAVGLNPVDVDVVHVTDGQGNRTARVEGYVLRRTVGVTSPDVALVLRVAQNSGSLMAQGVELATRAPRFYFGALESLKLELLREASANAEERARALIGAHQRLGRIVEASQGVFQITAPDSNETSDYGQYDTGTVQKTVRAVVTVAYQIERKS